MVIGNLKKIKLCTNLQKYASKQFNNSLSLSLLPCLAHLNFISHASFLGLVLVEGAEFPPLPVLIKVTRLHHELVLGTVDGEAFPTTSVAECPCLQEIGFRDPRMYNNTL